MGYIDPSMCQDTRGSVTLLERYSAEALVFFESPLAHRPPGCHADHARCFCWSVYCPQLVHPSRS